jgi:phage terminase large subunit
MIPAQDRIREWRLNPVKFVRDVFHVEPDMWQVDALAAAGGDISARRRLALKACTGPGKTAVLAWLGWQRLSCYGGKDMHPKGAAISCEGRDNLRDNLWAELSKWQAKSPFLQAAFDWNKEQISAKDHPETWFLSARSYPKSATAEEIGRSLSGLHSPFPFILLDETGSGPIQLGQKAEQIFTGGCVDGLIAQAGNPTSTAGLLYNSCVMDAANTNVITITADPKDPKRTPRVDMVHAQEMITKYGRDNPWVKATILGEFPESGFNTLLGPDQIRAAMRLHLKPDQYNFAQKRLGVDVARFGNDRTVIFPRQGLAAFKPVEMRGARTGDISARVLQAKLNWASEMEFVDGTGGFGAGVVDALLQSGTAPQEVHFSGKAIKPRYYNKRAEMWFEMAEWIKRGGALPNVPELVTELSTPQYTLKDGKLLLEDKEQIKERLGFSPDYGDALGLTFALPEMSTQLNFLGDPVLRSNNNTATTEYDPFEEKRLGY